MMNLKKCLIYNILILLTVILFIQNDIIYANIKDIAIIGENTVQIPVVGQSISEYRIQNNYTSQNIIFYIDEEKNGVSIDENGRLTIMPYAEKGNIRIYANIESEIKYFDIWIMESWTLGITESDGTKLSLPDTHEMPKITNLKLLEFSDNICNFIRILFILSFFLFFILYMWWKTKFLDNIIK